jgi:hypothetical protein
MEDDLVEAAMVVNGASARGLDHEQMTRLMTTPPRSFRDLETHPAAMVAGEDHHD